MFSPIWRRPASASYPQVWRKFEKTTKDGKTIKLRVQDATEEYFEDVLNTSIQKYLPEETWNSSTGCSSDPETLESFEQYIRGYLFPQNVFLICVVDDDDNSSGEKAELVGFNLTAVCIKKDEGDYSDLVKNDFGMRLLMVYSEMMKHSPDVYEKYKVDGYLGSFGLYVIQKYRGLSISQEILSARLQLCKAIGLKLSSSCFTATVSQVVAARVGFKEDSAVTYAHLEETVQMKFNTADKEAKVMSAIVD